MQSTTETERRDAPDYRRMVWTDVAKLTVVAAVLFAVLVSFFALTTRRHAHAVARPMQPQLMVANAKLHEWTIELSDTKLRPGRYTFRISNTGIGEHELIAFRNVPGGKLPVEGSSGDVNEEAPGLENATDGDNIAPGGTQTRAVDLTAPGAYIFVCNLPGHYKLGMHLMVTVG